MSSENSGPEILAFCQKNEIRSFKQRQIPLQIDDSFILQYQVDDSFLISNHENLPKTNLNYQRFIKCYHRLSNEELDSALTVPFNQVKEHILRNISCVGCRTSIDSFMKSLIEYGHPALEPLVMNENGSISINKSAGLNCDQIYQLFHIYGLKLKNLIETIPKSKKNRRCLIHSLDKTRSLNIWESVWEIMNNECRNEITTVEFSSLLTTIETYLRKFKFCSECRLKVLEAYDLLTDDCDCRRQETKGFCSVLYEGFRSCSNEKHIHVDCRKDFICKLINRAEIEIQGGRRERHAKTIDVAQEEILTCIGIHLFEKFEKLHRSMKSEDQTWKMIFSIGIDCLRLNFEKTIDQKQDFNLVIENLCEEMRLADQTKPTKKRNKRNKRKPMKPAQNSNKDTLKISCKSEEILTRRRANSCCSCLCHYCDEQSNTLSNTLKSSLIKSHSCPSLLTIISNSRMSTNSLPLSNSLDTLFATIATRECICHEKNLEKDILCDDCPISSSTSCIRCSTTRLDPGYSSEQDDNCSSNLCECTSTGCDDCSIECIRHEEDEGSMSMLSSGIYSHNCCFHENHRMVKLSDRTGKSKLTLQLSDDYPFFQMNFKQIWEENSSTNTTDQAFISDADRRQFFLSHKNFHKRRQQLRRRLKCKFQLWKQSFSYTT